MARARNSSWLLLVVAAAGTIALSGCVEAKPTPAETVVEIEKTIDQYVAELTQYTHPAELQLPAGASADEFGRWVTDLHNKWPLASCDRVSDIIRASVNLRIGDDSVEFYPKIAEANADALTVAMFGPDWPSKPFAVAWRDAAIKRNANGIDLCVQGLEGRVAIEEFVSASLEGSDAAGNPIYEVNVNIVSDDPNSSEVGPRTYVYDTGAENGQTTVDTIG